MRIIPLILCCLLSGCVARPHLDKQSFIFATPAITPAQGSPGARTLGLRSLRVAAPFEARSFVCRTGEFAYDRDPYAEFIVHPAEALPLAVRSGLRQTGAFRAVAEPGSALKPDTLVEIEVTQLYGDFRPSRKPSAVLSIRFTFFDNSTGIPGKVILHKDYPTETPLKAQTAEALIEGWNSELSQILESAARDFAQADGSAPGK